MAPYFTIKDGEAVPVDQLPDLSGFKSNLDGLCYCSSEETLPDGHKSLHWEQCKIFSPDEVDILSIADEYEVYCSTHVISNGVVKADTRYIRDLYQDLSREHKI